MEKATRPLAVDVSICMVSLNSWHVLEPCLRSLQDASGGISYEVIVVDNASTDGTPDRIAEQHPWIKLIRNDRNVGFSRGTNQGIEVSCGRHLLWLNTDTVLHSGALRMLVRFLDEHPRAAIVGPKVLNADGTFQPQCRRGLPTPEAALAYMLRLHHWWPNHPVAGQYLLTYLPVDDRNRVAAVSGCCLLARRTLGREIGPIDEAIFGFGEDIDWCVRAEKAGWEVWYEPASVITHLKGQGGVHARPYHKIRGIHQAMWVFYRKHMKSEYSSLVTALVGVGVGVSFAVSMSMTWIRRRVSSLRGNGARPRAAVAGRMPASAKATTEDVA